MHDIFISHASEDKETFVRPLASLLKGYGLDVWHDEFSLSVGDSLSKSIDIGLRDSRYGALVLSHAFIQKALAYGWTDYELRGLVARSIGRTEKVILPIWLGVTREDVMRFSPTLADLLSIDGKAKGAGGTSVDLLKVISPETLSYIARVKTAEEIFAAKKGGDNGSTKITAKLWAHTA